MPGRGGEHCLTGHPHSSPRKNFGRAQPTNRSAEPGSLAVRVSYDDRAELLAAAPDIYYVTDHYLNYSAVLVRLSRVTPDVPRDLLGMALQVRERDQDAVRHADRRKPV